MRRARWTENGEARAEDRRVAEEMAALGFSAADVREETKRREWARGEARW